MVPKKQKLKRKKINKRSRAKGKKRIVTISDLHCGHQVGLTPPLWHRVGSSRKFDQTQIELWLEYKRMIDALKPIDILFVNGDAVDGSGKRSGGSELITTDREEQVSMAKHAILECEVEDVIMTFGTPYHTGYDEDWESILAKEVGAKKIGGQEWPEVHGVVFDLKHKVGSSTIPHGRGTPIAKERLWNYLWAESEQQPKSDIIIRSHVHYFYFTGENSWLGMTTPALQGLGTKFGARQCSGTVNFGVVYFDVFDDGTYSWGKDIASVKSQKAITIKL